MSKTKRRCIVAMGFLLAVPFALMLSTRDASATGYAIEFLTDGFTSCNPGGTNDCPQS